MLAHRWWAVEDGVFANCEDTRAQEQVLRRTKEETIETDLAAREQVGAVPLCVCCRLWEMEFDGVWRV